MDEQERLKLIGELAHCCKVPIVLPDIADSRARDKFVLRAARKEFEELGVLPRCLILRATKPALALVMITLEVNYEQAGHVPAMCYAFAKGFQAKQIYQISEMWFAPGQDGLGVMPRNHPERKEGLMVCSEDATRTPPMRLWTADITRDKDGKGTAGPWQRFHEMEGRLIMVLPPEFYGKKAQA